MKLFKKKEQEIIVDDRTELEKSFEEKGKNIGKKTGKVVQKGVDKLHQVKAKLEEDGTMDKLRHLSDKVDDTIDSVVDKVAKKSKQITSKKSSKKEAKEPGSSEDLFYE
jgi:hypothetical protein